MKWRVPPSPLSLAELARLAERRGIEPVRMDVAEAQFPPPRIAVEQTIEALRRGAFGYTPPRGLPELIDVVVEFLRETRSLDYSREEIVVTPGAKPAIYALLATLISPGDRVVLFSPYWPSFRACIEFVGGRVVEVPLHEEEGPDEEALKEAMHGARVLIVNSPHNPTGYVMDEEDLRLIRDLSVDHGVFVVSDEVDWAFVYDGRHISPASLDDLRERTAIIDSVSKVFCMPAWRVGWIAGLSEVISDVVTFIQHSIGSPPAFAQLGATAALKNWEEHVRCMVETCRQNRDALVRVLSELEVFNSYTPRGGFCVFPSTKLDGDYLARRLAQHGVLVAPGRIFGEKYRNRVRICYAIPRERLLRALEHIREACGVLRTRRSRRSSRREPHSVGALDYAKCQGSLWRLRPPR